MNQRNESSTLTSIARESPWPHRLAVLLACATFPLIWVGGLVTTYDAGMAVPDWPSTYGYNLLMYPWQTWISGPWDLFIEHGHRLLGAGVGLLTLILSAVVWRTESRTWVRWFSLACVFGVMAQGVLGGLRVLWDERVLAKIHGCTGPLFFCLTVAMVIVTSRRWRGAETSTTVASAQGVASLAWLVTVLAYVQIVVGAQLRHITLATTPSFFRVAVFFHIGLAVALLIHSVYLAGKLFRRRVPAQRWSALFLVGLVASQIALGSSSWIVNYGPPAWLGDWLVGYTVAAKTLTQSLVVTAHVAMGSLILVTCLAIALTTSREQGTGRVADSEAPRKPATRQQANVSPCLRAIG